MPRFIVTRDEVYRVQRCVHADSVEEAMEFASEGQGDVKEEEFVSHHPQAEVREVKLFRVEASMDKVYHLIVEAADKDEAYSIASQEDDGWEEGEEIADTWTLSPLIEVLDEDEIEEYEGEDADEDYEPLHEECIRILQEILWPDGDSEHEWDSDTLGHIANALTEHGFGPEE